MSYGFDGKTVLITGGGSGIGKATALSFAAEGTNVVVADINTKNGEETTKLIQERGGSAIFIKVDISKRKEIEDLLNFSINQFGKVDYAVNCAGITGGISLPTDEYPEDRWEQVISTNLTGTWYCMQVEIKQMLSQGSGAIVNVASAAGLQGHPLNSPYSASKHGIVGITKTAAIEYATQNIRINAICPTSIETPMIMDGRLNLRNDPDLLEKFTNYQAMKRMGSPQEAADVVLWLCSEKASFITGHAMPVDGGAFA